LEVLDWDSQGSCLEVWIVHGHIGRLFIDA
jgi:hypothetical protein